MGGTFRAPPAGPADRINPLRGHPTAAEPLGRPGAPAMRQRARYSGVSLGCCGRTFRSLALACWVCAWSIEGSSVGLGSWRSWRRLTRLRTGDLLAAVPAWVLGV